MNILDHLDKLKVFTAVAEQGTLNAASRSLGLTQPSLTRAIQVLEQATGFPLFHRNRSGVTLTEGGKIFYEASARILKEAVDATQRGAHSEEEMSGEILIGTYESLAEYLWPDFLLAAEKEFPHLNISLKTNSKDGHSRELASGRLDILIDAEARPQAGLTLWQLYSDRFAFYSKKESAEISPEEARGLSLLYVRGVFDENNLTLEEHLRGRGFQFRREITFDSFTTVRRMAAKGLGLAILPRRLAEESALHPVKLKGFAEGFGPHRIYATISTHRENDKRVKKLVSFMKAKLK